MPNRTIDVRRWGHVARLTLHRLRPDEDDPLQLAAELRDACRSVREEDAVWVVLLEGEAGAFAFGTQRPPMATSGSSAEGTRDFFRMGSVAAPVAAVEKPVVVAITGDCLGQGLELALACDLRVASRTARFGLPQVANGFLPRDGGTQRLARIVGRAAALELILTAAVIGAEHALRLGLVNSVVEPEALLPQAEAMAEQIAGSAPIALRYVKEAVAKGLDLPLAQGLALEADLSIILQTTQDREEGLRSFFEKRKPVFKGS